MYASSMGEVPAESDLPAAEALAETQTFWSEWTQKNRYEGKYAEAVGRSLITLKAMTYRLSGGIVAAATTSLPEKMGGPRNWDYRYCWLRDTSFTLLVLMQAGYVDEAIAWRKWLLRTIAGAPDQVQTIYGIRGERQLVEWEADWLPGYENSRPVRIGSAGGADQPPVQGVAGARRRDMGDARGSETLYALEGDGVGGAG
jgi:GH15 family glucan-1,4-alpha-glucosidase